MTRDPTILTKCQQIRAWAKAPHHRGILGLLHRWIGLFIAFWVLLASLTGMFLAWYEEIDVALNGDLLTVTTPAPGTPYAPLSSLISSAEQNFGPYHDVSIVLPKSPDLAVRVMLEGGASSEKIEAFYEPVSGAFIGARNPGNIRWDSAHLPEMIYTLHYTLFAGTTGELFLGLIALLWAITSSIAIKLAIPKWSFWKRSLLVARAAPPARRELDLHRVFGIFFLPLSMILAVTAFVLQWETVMVDGFSAAYEDAPNYALYSASQDPGVSFDQALLVGRNLTGLKADSISRSRNGNYEISFFSDRDTDRFGSHIVEIDSQSGEILSNANALDDLSAMDAVLSLQYSIHSGQILGIFGRILVFFVGLTTTIGVITGLMIWRRRWKVRRRRRGAKN